MKQYFDETYVRILDDNGNEIESRVIPSYVTEETDVLRRVEFFETVVVRDGETIELQILEE